MAQDDPISPLAHALDRIGDRWTLLIVDALQDGPKRGGDHVDELGLAPNNLTQRLRQLEQETLITARPYQERPPRFVYELSAAGAELGGALRLLSDWGARHGEVDHPRHGACGTPLEVRWWCAACAEVVDDPDTEDVTVV
jgi:DNA-binding HxlR family transcriptional regulator